MRREIEITMTSISRPVVKSTIHYFSSISCQSLSFVASSDCVRTMVTVMVTVTLH
jgi:hypothetical protein